MPFLSIVSGCFNEEENVRELYDRVCRVFQEELPEYSFEFILIDNASQDKTVQVLKELAACDKRVKIIVNNRNFGHIRSGAIMRYCRRAGRPSSRWHRTWKIPRKWIPQFVRKWEQGFKIQSSRKKPGARSFSCSQ